MQNSFSHSICCSDGTDPACSRSAEQWQIIETAIVHQVIEPPTVYKGLVSGNGLFMVHAQRPAKLPSSFNTFIGVL
jgi:hypothetical protein